MKKETLQVGKCKRTIQWLYHAMQRLGIYEKIPSKRKESEPNKWVSGEYSRLRYTCFTNAHDTYASSEFARRLVKYFPFKIKTIQTDNGFEFTNRLS